MTACVLTFVTLAAGLFFYPVLPDVMMTHWNAEGVPDGSMPKFWGVAIMPLLLAFSISILAAIPHIDPLKNNIASFRTQYNIFVVLLSAVLAFVQLAVLAVNLGTALNMSTIVMPAVGVLFFWLGSILPRTKRNFFFGVRTPWTLSSDTVWKRTHKMAGWIFRALGLLAVFTIIVPAYAVPLFFGPLVVAVVGLVAYSYFVYCEVEH